MVEEIALDLVERVRMIIELWGEGEPLNLERLTEIADSLYGAPEDAVLDAVITNLKDGLIGGQFYSPS
jgi:hypothetical protein